MLLPPDGLAQVLETEMVIEFGLGIILTGELDLCVGKELTRVAHFDEGTLLNCREEEYAVPLGLHDDAVV